MSADGDLPARVAAPILFLSSLLALRPSAWRRLRELLRSDAGALSPLPSGVNFSELVEPRRARSLVQIRIERRDRELDQVLDTDSITTAIRKARALEEIPSWEEIEDRLRDRRRWAELLD